MRRKLPYTIPSDLPPKTPKKDEPLEDAEQAWLFDEIFARENQTPELKWIFHVPNGGFRAKRTASLLKLQGVRSGVPDLCWPMPRKDPKTGQVYHSCYIEMKRKSLGRLEDTQKEWRDWLISQGFFWKLCRGGEDAWETIKEYLAFPKADAGADKPHDD